MSARISLSTATPLLVSFNGAIKRHLLALRVSRRGATRPAEGEARTRIHVVDINGLLTAGRADSTRHSAAPPRAWTNQDG